MNCVTVFWKVWGQLRATNELCGSCLKDMMVLMTGVVCTTDNDSFMQFVLCMGQSTNWITLCSPVGVLFYASCIILAQQKLLVMIRCYQRCKYSFLMIWSKLNFCFQKTRKYEKLATRNFELANFDSQLELATRKFQLATRKINSKTTTRNSQILTRNSQNQLASYNSQLALATINSQLVTRNSQIIQTPH